MNNMYQKHMYKLFGSNVPGKDSITLLKYAANGDFFKFKEYVEHNKYTPSNLDLEKDISGNTVLHLAAHSGSIGMINYLMMMGMNIDQKNTFGQSVFDIAVMTRRNDIVESICKFKNKASDAMRLYEKIKKEHEMLSNNNQKQLTEIKNLNFKNKMLEEENNDLTQKNKRMRIECDMLKQDNAKLKISVSSLMEANKK